MHHLVFILIALLIGVGALGISGEFSRHKLVDERYSSPEEILPSGDRLVDLSNRGLSVVPSSVFSQSDTTTLDLSHNLLSGALPAEINRLTNLTVLDLSDNAFTGVPAEVGQLSKLRILDLSNNDLTGLPHEIGNLSALEILDIRGNDYSEFDVEEIRRKLPRAVEIRVQ